LDTHVISLMLCIDGAKLDFYTKENTVMDGVGVRDLRGSLALGLISPRNNEELAFAKRVLLAYDNVVPLFINKLEKKDGKVQVMDRQTIYLSCEKIDTLGFDYYNLASNRVRVMERTKAAGYLCVPMWESSSEYKRLLQRIDDDEVLVGDVFYLSSSWFSRHNDSRYVQFLTYCDLKYVGGHKGLWNWIAIVKSEPVYKSDELVVIFNMIPKLYRLCILYGLKKVVWPKDSKDFLKVILGYYGLLAKLDVVHGIIGHMLVDIEVPLKIKLKPLVGVPKRVSNSWFSDDFELSTELLDVTQTCNNFDLLESVLGDIPIKNNDDDVIPDLVPLDDGVGYITQSDGDLQVISSNVIFETPIIKDKSTKFKSLCDLVQRILDGSVLSHEESYKWTDSVVSKLRCLEWDHNLLEWFLDECCLVMANLDGVLVGATSVQLYHKIVRVTYRDKSDKDYKYISRFKRLKKGVMLWDMRLGYIFEYIEFLGVNSFKVKSTDSILIDYDRGVIDKVVFKKTKVDVDSGSGDSILDIEDLDGLFNNPHWQLVDRSNKVKVRFKED
jgi:hypothetical protein